MDTPMLVRISGNIGYIPHSMMARCNTVVAAAIRAGGALTHATHLFCRMMRHGVRTH
jgi:hypothetical protein